MGKIFYYLKKFWLVVLIGVVAYAFSDPTRKAKFMAWITGLPFIGVYIGNLMRGNSPPSVPLTIIPPATNSNSNQVKP